MLVLCVPLYLPTIIGHNFHAKELWMTPSAGGPHNSFQPIIQMESAIQTGSLQVSFLSPLSWTSAQLVPSLTFISLHFTGQPDCYLLHSTKKNELSCSPKTTQSLIKPAVWGVAGVIVEEIMVRQRFLSVRDCVVRAEHPASTLVWESASICSFERQACVMRWKLKSLIWQGVTVATAMDRLFNRPTRHSAGHATP